MWFVIFFSRRQLVTGCNRNCKQLQLKVWLQAVQSSPVPVFFLVRQLDLETLHGPCHSGPCHREIDEQLHYGTVCAIVDLVVQKQVR
jgi:hypothetical protein